jgi:alpha-beta hydrolase superfamily lysophospholipase
MTEAFRTLMTGTDTHRVDAIRAKDGTEIPVRVFNGGGTPVIMLHGLHSHSGWFLQSGAFLASLGCPVYAFDRRGSGLSRERRGHVACFRNLLDELDAVVALAARAHAAAKVHVLGHCLGTLPATLFACRNPGRVASLILSTPGIYTHIVVPALKKVRIGFLGPLRSRSPIPFPLEPEVLADLEVHRRFIAADELAGHEATASFCFSLFAAALSLRWNIRRLRVPTFVALAGGDRLSDNHRTLALLRRSPAVMRAVTYPEATHILEYSSEKDRFFADLADWIRQNSATEAGATR